MSARERLSHLPWPRRLLVYAKGAHQAIPGAILFLVSGLACEAAMLAWRVRLGWSEEMGLAWTLAGLTPFVAIVLIGVLRSVTPTLDSSACRWAMGVGPAVGFGVVAWLSSNGSARSLATAEQLATAQELLGLSLALGWGLGLVSTMCAMALEIVSSRTEEGSWVVRTWEKMRRAAHGAIESAAEHAEKDPQTVASIEYERLMRSLRARRETDARKGRGGGGIK